MSLINFPDNVIEDIYSNLDQKSLVSMKHSCKFFDILSNQYLLKHLYFYDDSRQTLPLVDYLQGFKFDFTVIPLSKLDSFIRFIEKNTNLIELIDSIVFNSTESNVLISKFINLLIRNKRGSLSQIRFESNVDNLIFLLTQQSGSGNNQDIILYNHNLSASNLYENDELDDSLIQPNSVSLNPSYIYQCEQMQPTSSNSLPFELKELQIFSVDEAELLNLSNMKFEKIELTLQQVDQTDQLSSEVIENWSNNLEALQILNFRSFNYFSRSMLAYMNNYENPNENSLFANLQCLTISLTDSNLDNDIKVLRSLNMGKIKQLEIKFKRKLLHDNGDKIRAIVKLLNDKEMGSQVESFSLINSNDYNMLTDNVFKSEIFNDSNLCLALMNDFNLINDLSVPKNLKHLTISLNNFLTVVDVKLEGNCDYKTFVVNETYLLKKREYFEKLLSLKNLQTLVIPDFLFNWLPFLDEGITFNGEYDELYCESMGVKSTAIVRKLYSRFKNFDDRSGLGIINKPIYHDGQEIFMGFYLDKLAPVMLHIAESLPKLELLNLGGALVSIHRSSPTSADVQQLVGVYDDWVFTNCLNE